MAKFISNSKFPQIEVELVSCAGKIYSTHIGNIPSVICSFVNGTASIQQIHKRSEKATIVPPADIAKQENLYPTAEGTTARAYLKYYATEPLYISGIFSGGIIADVGKWSPLVLYYRYVNNQFSLFLYNFEDHSKTLLMSKEIATTSSFGNCNFLIGAFDTAKQHDIFVSCSILGMTNQFLMHNKQYSITDSSMGQWCDSSIIRTGDFNGDQRTDLLCVKSQEMMINKKTSFNI